MKKTKKNGWLKRMITKLDCLMFSGDAPDYKPMLHSIMALGIYVGIGLGIVVYASQAFGASGVMLSVIASLILAGAVAYTIFKTLPNIKMFESIIKKILYIFVTLAGLMISITLGVYLLIITLMVLVLYVVFTMCFGGGTSKKGGDDALGREHVATLDNGVKIYKGKDLLFNVYYIGNDDNYYETDDNERTFTMK